MPWAVQFPRASSVHWYMRHTGVLDDSAPLTPHLHPTELYMCLGLLLVVFPALKSMSRRAPFRGSVALGYLFLYGILRFTVEIFRGDSAQPVLGMTVSQLISLGLCGVSLIAFAAVQSSLFRGIWGPVESSSD